MNYKKIMRQKRIKLNNSVIKQNNYKKKIMIKMINMKNF